MKSLKQSYPHYFFSQKLFGLSVFLAALPPLWWLLQAWLFGFYDTAGLWGGIGLLILLLWSVSSPKVSCRKANKSLITSLFVVAAILQLSSFGINVNVMRGLSLILDIYALSLWLGVKIRKRPLASEWLVILFVFCLPVDLPGSGVNTLVFTGSTLAILMAVARPNLIQSILSLGLLSGLAVLGSSLRFYFEADGGMMEVVALAPEIITVFIWFFWVYRKPIKANTFKDNICWSIPKTLRQDGWWLELPKLRRLRTAWTFASIVFVIIATFVAISNDYPAFSSKPTVLSQLELSQ